MVFSADMLLSENYESPTKMENISTIEESYFNTALSYVNEMSRDYSNANKVFYKAVLEANNDDEVIHEAFSDFTSKVKEIIQKFLNFIKSVFNKFIIAMNKLIKSDKYLKDHKKEFSNFSPEHEFEMNIYNYTKLDDDNFPAINAYDTYMNNLKSYTLKTDSSKSITSDSLYDRLSDIYTDIVENSNDWYDLFRGEVLGKSGESYSSSEFEKELHDIFRDDSSTKTKETITFGIVNQSLERFLAYDKTIKHVKKLKDDLEKQYKSIKDNLKNLDIMDFTNNKSVFSSIFTDYDTSSSEIMNLNLANSDKARDKDIRSKMDNINKVRISRIEGMCNIHSLAFTKKLDAIKEAYNQDKKLLYVALKKMHPISTKESYVYVNEMPDEMDRLFENYRYSNFLIDQLNNQNNIMNYIGECVALESGDLKSINYINESAIDVIKSIIAKIIEAIKNMFGKFTTKMSQIFTKDETYLKKYKNVILNKPFKDRDITMYNYNTARLDDYKVPRFDINKFDQLIKSDEGEFEELFIQFHATELPGIKKDGGEIKEKIIKAIRGEDTVDTNLSSLDSKRRSMYEFCVQYKKIQNMLNKDMETVANNRTLLNSALSKISGEFSDTANKIKDDAVTKHNNPTPATPSAENNSAVYSNVYGTFIMEDGMKIGKANKDNSSTGGSGGSHSTSNTVVNQSASGIDKDTAATAAGTAAQTLRVNVNNSDADNADQNAQKAKDKIDEYREGSGRYFNACANIMAAKLTVCEAIYKDYMKIIRTHVSDYGGSADSNSTSNNNADNGVDNSMNKTIEIQDPEDANKKHTFRYDAAIKAVKVTQNKILDSVKFKLFKKIKKNQNNIDAWNDTLMKAAKQILNGAQPTIDQVFYFDDQPCVYSGHDGGWVTCDTQKKVSTKIKDKVNDIKNSNDDNQ